MSGFIEWIESFKGEVQEKSRNPFIPTFLFVWTLRHWEAVYSFFYFGEEFNLDQRIERFKLYFQDYSYLTLLGTIGITFVVILSGYFLGNLTRLISNFFENNVTPIIYKITAPGKVVMKSELDELQIEFDDLEKRFDFLRIEKNRLANENEVLFNRISLNKDANSNSEDDEAKTLENFGVLTEDTGDAFLKISNSIGKNELLPIDGDYIAKFLNLGLIKRSSYTSGAKRAMFSLTDSGRDLFRILSKDR